MYTHTDTCADKPSEYKGMQKYMYSYVLDCLSKLQPNLRFFH